MNMKFVTLLMMLAFLPSAFAAEEYELWKSGRHAWHQRDWNSAIKIFQEFVASYPESRYRCKVDYYLGYCYDKSNDKQKAFDIFSTMISEAKCRTNLLDDARAKNLNIAFEMVKDGDESKKKVLIDNLSVNNSFIRLSSAVLLSELDDRAGMSVFFDIMENVTDQESRDTAARHILKLGSKEEKERLQKLLTAAKTNQKNAKMVRLVMRDLNSNEQTMKLNLPIALFNVVIKSLTPEQLDLIEKEANINLRRFDIELDKMPAGKVLFRVVDKNNQEIKVYLE